MQRRRLSTIALILFAGLTAFYVLPARGQIIEIRGELDSPDSYACTLSGLKGMGSDCGTEYEDMVFTAEIRAITPAAGDEYRLVLQPQVIFKGTPTAGMEIVTSQRKCFPAIAVGDSWLFSLDRDAQSKSLKVGYGSRSGPVADEGEEIALLRRLAGLDTKGLVRGRAYFYQDQADATVEKVASQNHSIVLTRIDNGEKLRVVTDEDGKFEFDPLLAGEYDLDPNTAPGLWTMWSGKLEIKAHGCTFFDLDFQIDGEIAGKLVLPDDVEPDSWRVEASPVDDPEVVPASESTNQSGQFVLRGLKPGKYLIKLKKTVGGQRPNLSVDLFAPGTEDRGSAQVVEVGKASHVDGIEIVVPRSAFTHER